MVQNGAWRDSRPIGSTYSVGKRPQIDLAIAGLIAGGHVLLDDVPGTGDCDDDDGGLGATPEELQAYELAQDNSLQVGNPNLQPMTSTKASSIMPFLTFKVSLQAP